MKSKVIYRKGVAYNANTGKKMFCIEARVDGKWMPAFFESGFFITESAATVSKEVCRRNFQANQNNVQAGTQTEMENRLKTLLKENERLRSEIGSRGTPENSPPEKFATPGDPEETPKVDLFDEK